MQKIYLNLIFILLFSVEIVESQTTTPIPENTMWVNSFEKAKVIASEKKIAILLFFTGSDTCANCNKMYKNILDTEEFIAYSRDRFVILQVDYPDSKTKKLSVAKLKQNKDLVRKYNSKCILPQIVVIDAKGSIKATANYLDIPVSEYLPQFKALLNMFN